MKRYIVTEEQLKELKLQVQLLGDDLESDLKDLWKAEDACLELEVPAKALGFYVWDDEQGHVHIPFEESGPIA